MNTNTVAKHYDKLTPWERVPLIAAAKVRGDEAEAERLMQSTPRVRYRLGNCHGLILGLQEQAVVYLLRQLDLAVTYQQISLLLNDAPFVFATEENRQELENQESTGRLTDVWQFLAFRIVSAADGWKLFCDALKIDPDMLLCFLPGHDTVAKTVEDCRATAYTPSEAVECFRRRFEKEEKAAGQTPSPNRENRIETPEEIAKTMRESVESRVAEWK